MPETNIKAAIIGLVSVSCMSGCNRIPPMHGVALGGLEFSFSKHDSVLSVTAEANIGYQNVVFFPSYAFGTFEQGDKNFTLDGYEINMNQRPKVRTYEFRDLIAFRPGFTVQFKVAPIESNILRVSVRNSYSQSVIEYCHSDHRAKLWTGDVLLR